MRSKLYPYIILLMLVMINTIKVHAQNVGIGIDTPSQKLDVNGGIRVGGTTVANPGSIRWNEIKSDFEGYNGVDWVSMTGGKGKWGDQSSYAIENTASQFNLINADIPGTELGSALAGVDDWIVAGAYRDGTPANEDRWHTGSIRMMKRNDDKWKLEHSVYDPDIVNSDFFGYSVDMSVTHVITGAPNADMVGVPEQGKAYIYTYDTNTIVHQATLLASDAQTSDAFGHAVGISGDYTAVSAPYNDILGVSNMGRVYIYKRSGATWPEFQVLTPSDGAIDDRYGSAIAIWGEYLAISSPYKTYNGIFYAGKVYLYRKNGPSWSLIQQLNSPAANANELFGISLVIRDNVLLVGASDYVGNSNDGNGSVYIYEISNNTAVYEDVIQASDGEKGDVFGKVIDYLNGVILVGAQYAAVRSSAKHGKSYVYKKINGNWEEEAILTASSDEHNIQFGTAVALVPDCAVVGAPFADLISRVNNGQLFFFKQN